MDNIQINVWNTNSLSFCCCQGLSTVGLLQLTEITKEKYFKMGPKHEDNKYLMYV